MNDERDELLNEIGRELDLDPSTGFRARVRCEIDAHRTRAKWRVAFFVTATIALLVIVAIKARDDVASSNPLDRAPVAYVQGAPTVSDSPVVRSSVSRSQPESTRRKPAVPDARAVSSATDISALVLVDRTQVKGLEDMLTLSTVMTQPTPIVVEPIAIVPFTFAFVSGPRIQGENQ